jgi:hypothetical protein
MLRESEVLCHARVISIFIGYTRGMPSAYPVIAYKGRREECLCGSMLYFGGFIPVFEGILFLQ